MQRMGYFTFISIIIGAASLASLFVVRANMRKPPPGTTVVVIPPAAVLHAPGSRASRFIIMLGFGIGVVLLFMSLALCLAGAWGLLPSWSLVPIPDPIRFIAYGLIALYYLWGVLVIRYNANYTPCYKAMSGEYRIATAGPYSIVRHPMYAAKAAFPILMFLATGFLPFLLGLISWTALPYQARMEEEGLAELLGDRYRLYAAGTGRFFPRILKRTESR